MSKLAKVFRAWLYVEAAMMGAALGALTNKKKASRNLPTPKLSNPSGFKRLSTRAPLALVAGVTYAAELDVPFFIGALVTESALREGLKKEGFTVTLLSESMPRGWPGTPGADWYVLAKYTGRPKTDEVPGAVRAAWKRG